MAVKIFEIVCFAGGVDIVFIKTEEEITNEQFNNFCQVISQGLGRDATVEKVADVLIKKHNFQKVVPDGKFFLI